MHGYWTVVAMYMCHTVYGKNWLLPKDYHHVFITFVLKKHLFKLSQAA